MKYLARIEAGRVAEVIIAPHATWPAEVRLPGTWVNVTELTGQRPGPGWTYDGAKFTPPPRAP